MTTIFATKARMVGIGVGRTLRLGLEWPGRVGPWFDRCGNSVLRCGNASGWGVQPVDRLIRTVKGTDRSGSGVTWIWRTLGCV